MRNTLLNKTITFILIVFLVGISTNLTISSSAREKPIQENNKMDCPTMYGVTLGSANQFIFKRGIDYNINYKGKADDH